MAAASELTKEEHERYDRQIRMWGLQAQKNMREGRILFFNLDGVNSEVLKNCVLAGVGGCCLVDDSQITKKNCETHFYVTNEAIGSTWSDVAVKYFQPMNPNCKLWTNKEENILNNLENLKEFKIVCLSNQNLETQRKIAAACRNFSIPYFYSRSSGIYAYSFTDCLKNRKIVHKDIEGETVTEQSEVEWCDFETSLTATIQDIKRKRKKGAFTLIAFQALESFESLPGKQALLEKINEMMKTRNLTEKRLFFEDVVDDLLRCWNVNLAMTNALLGGFVANSVLAKLQATGKRVPFHNMLCCNIRDTDVGRFLAE